MGRKDRDMVWSGPIPLGQQSTNRRNITTVDVLPEEQGV